MKLHVDCQKWDEAQMLASQNPGMGEMINLPYADWLSANDRFDEAQQAYKKANRPDLSLKIIEFLTANAISEKRFKDAAQYYWALSTESLKIVKNADKPSKEDQKYLKNHDEYLKLAEIYQAYSLVSDFMGSNNRMMVIGDELMQEAIFNAARFLVNNL